MVRGLKKWDSYTSAKSNLFLYPQINFKFLRYVKFKIDLTEIEFLILYNYYNWFVKEQGA